jgi:hypothetical protein
MEKKKEPKKKKPEKAKTQPSEPQDEQEKPFDFGGLPQRDLKKNLGCG